MHAVDITQLFSISGLSTVGSLASWQVTGALWWLAPCLVEFPKGLWKSSWEEGVIEWCYPPAVYCTHKHKISVLCVIMMSGPEKYLYFVSSRWNPLFKWSQMWLLTSLSWLNVLILSIRNVFYQLNDKQFSRLVRKIVWAILLKWEDSWRYSKWCDIILFIMGSEAVHKTSYISQTLNSSQPNHNGSSNCCLI